MEQHERAPTRQQPQFEAMDDMYHAMNQFGFNHPDTKKAIARYEMTVRQLQLQLGPDAHCNDVDADLWELVCNLWKSDFGSKPNHHMTKQQAHDYIDNRAKNLQQVPG